MQDWDKLRVFYTVAIAKSFTLAAESLGLSQSALSRQIAALESSLNAILFHRLPRGLKLTEQGEVLFATAQEMAAGLASAEARLYDMREQASGTLRIATTPAFGTEWLSRIIPGFVARYPQIRPCLLMDDSGLNLAMREADIAIQMTPPTEPGLIQRHIIRFHYGLYASAAYLRQRGTPTRREDLRHHAIIGIASLKRLPFSNAYWLLELPETSENHAEIFTASNMLSVRNMIDAGLGIGVLADFLVRDMAGMVRVLPEIKPPSVNGWMVYAEDMRHSRRVTAFRDYVLEHLAEDGLGI